MKRKQKPKPLIALAFNLKKNFSEEQAEFDAPCVIDQIAATLEQGGANVVMSDVTPTRRHSLAQAIDYMANVLKPDLVFNIAEGVGGRDREARHPALYEAHRLPYTGSDAYTLMVTQDKWMTKQVALDCGMLTPNSTLVRERGGVAFVSVPCIVKPNFEGSSKGITSHSVVRESLQLQKVVDRQVRNWPQGVLSEEFIEGKDVTMFWSEAHGPLMPVEIWYADKKDRIYDRPHKSEKWRKVRPVPYVNGTGDTCRQMMMDVMRLVSALRLRDFARFDFRVDKNGRAWFLEVNALPSLEHDAGPLGPHVLGIATVAAEASSLTYEKIVRGIVHTAAQRWKLDLNGYDG